MIARRFHILHSVEPSEVPKIKSYAEPWGLCGASWLQFSLWVNQASEALFV